MHYLPTKILTFRVPGRPKSGQVGVELALSWHLKGILKEANFKMPIRSLWTGAGTICPPLLEALGAPGGGDVGEGAALGPPRDPKSEHYSREVMHLGTFALLLLRCLR